MWPNPLKVLMIIQVVLDILVSIVSFIGIFVFAGLASTTNDDGAIGIAIGGIVLLAGVMAVSVYRMVVFVKALKSEFGAEVNKKVRMTTVIIAGVSICLNIVSGILNAG